MPGTPTSTHIVVPTRRSPATADTATRTQCPHGAARLAPCEGEASYMRMEAEGTQAPMAHKTHWRAHNKTVCPQHIIAESAQCVCTTRAALEPRLGTRHMRGSNNDGLMGPPAHTCWHWPDPHGASAHARAHTPRPPTTTLPPIPHSFQTSPPHQPNPSMGRPHRVHAFRVPRVSR